MEHSIALTDEKVNTFEMTLGNESFRASQRIMLCKKNVFSENRFGPNSSGKICFYITAPK